MAASQQAMKPTLWTDRYGTETQISAQCLIAAVFAPLSAFEPRFLLLWAILAAFLAGAFWWARK